LQQPGRPCWAVWRRCPHASRRTWAGIGTSPISPERKSRTAVVG